MVPGGSPPRMKRESGENPEQPALLCDGQPSGYATREKGKAEALDEIESGDLLYMSMIFFGGERTAVTLCLFAPFFMQTKETAWTLRSYPVFSEPERQPF